jgi:membrane protease YdiL (CAAX protease family)
MNFKFQNREQINLFSVFKNIKVNYFNYIILTSLFYFVFFYWPKLKFGNENVIYLCEKIFLEIFSFITINIDKYFPDLNFIFPAFLSFICVLSVFCLCLKKLKKAFQKNLLFIILSLLLSIFWYWTVIVAIYFNYSLFNLYFKNITLEFNNLTMWGIDWLYTFSYQLKGFKISTINSFSDTLNFFNILFVLFLIKFLMKLRWKNLFFSHIKSSKIPFDKKKLDLFLYVLITLFLAILVNYKSIVNGAKVNYDLSFIFFLQLPIIYFEEIIFRNLILRVLSFKYSFIFANVIHSCLFVYYHFLRNYDDFFLLFVGSFFINILIGIVWKKYGIFYSSIIHYINNIIGILIIS